MTEDGIRFWSKSISEAYHKAKADGSNPELVKAVEDLLGKPKAETPNVEDWSRDVESTAKALEGVDATFSADLSDSKLSVDERKQSAKKQAIKRVSDEMKKNNQKREELRKEYNKKVKEGKISKN